jgi:hypothetical protein
MQQSEIGSGPSSQQMNRTCLSLVCLLLKKIFTSVGPGAAFSNSKPEQVCRTGTVIQVARPLGVSTSYIAASSAQRVRVTLRASTKQT